MGKKHAQVSGNCVGGDRITTLEEMFRLYDKLPAEVRNALANARHSWGTNGFLALVRRHGVAKTVALLEKSDYQVSLSTVRKLYGNDYPIETI